MLDTTTLIALAGLAGVIVGGLIAIAGGFHSTNALPLSPLSFFVSPDLARERLEEMKKQTRQGNKVTAFGMVILVVGALVIIGSPLIANILAVY